MRSHFSCKLMNELVKTNNLWPFGHKLRRKNIFMEKAPLVSLSATRKWLVGKWIRWSEIKTTSTCQNRAWKLPYDFETCPPPTVPPPLQICTWPKYWMRVIILPWKSDQNLLSYYRRRNWKWINRTIYLFHQLSKELGNCGKDEIRDNVKIIFLNIYIR